MRLQRLLPAVFAALLLLALGWQPALAQTLGQQVGGQPYTGGGQGAATGGQSGSYGQGAGQQPLGLPQSAPVMSQPLPGMPASGYSMNGAMGNQQMVTSMDIPQVSISTEVATGDLLDVTVFDTPELSGRFRINNQGDIVLPLAGTLHVAGLTAPEIAEAVTAKYKDTQILVRPQVSVFVAEFSTRGVTITGAARNPGIYQLTAPLNLTDMLTRAGGLAEDSSKTVSIVHRNDPAHIITVKINVGQPTPASIAAANIPVLPGDTIYIARSGVVYLVGDISRPGGYQVEHNNRLTLLEAIALAGGPTQTSKLWDARLIRRSATGREEIKVDLKKILYGGGPDMLMVDGDILYVPISQRKVYTLRAIDAAINAASAYALYRLSTNN